VTADPPTADGPAVLYPLIADPGNSRVFDQWLSSNDDYRTADTDRSLREASFDLCIVDDEAFTRSIDDLQAVKEAAAPALCPVLLLLSEQRSDIIESDHGRIADNVFATTVDEIVAMPIRQSELEWRIQALLRLRRQSRELHTRTQRLERYEEIIQRLDDPIMLQDRAGEFRLFNDAVAEYAGVAPEALHGIDEFEFMDEATARRIDGWKRTVLALEEPVQYEIEPGFELSDATATFSTKRFPYYGADGELVGTIAICRNVTQLKEREGQLRQFERAVTGANDLIAAVDTDERFLFANPPYRAHHGIEDEDVTDMTVAAVLSDEAYDAVTENIDRALAGEEVEFRTTRTHPDRGERILDVRYYPLADDGTTNGVVAVLRDVTGNEERKRQLRVIDRVFRHNLRNDLTVIRGLADEIASQSGGDVAATAAEITAQADGLLTTSEKSRDITQVLSERPEPHAVQMDAIVEEVATAARRQWDDVDVTVSASETVRARVSKEIDRALTELVHNAVVHNARPTPTVELSVETTDNRVVVHVVDDGPGIPEMEGCILESGRGVEELYHGSGLGLWLVYWIVHRSGGHIEVSDEDPRGSRITIDLPRARS